MNNTQEAWLLVNEKGSILQTNELDRAFQTDHDTPLRVIEYRKYKKAMNQIDAFKAEVKFVNDSFLEILFLYNKMKTEIHRAGSYLDISP